MSGDRPQPFDAALSLKVTESGRLEGHTHPGYANMVGPFGGLTNALMLQAALVHPSRIGVPVALTVNFAGRIVDGSFEIEVTPARTNRSTQHWCMNLSQGGAVATTATAVFAERRPSWSVQEATFPSGLPPASELTRAPSRGFPEWVARYDMRFVKGALDALDGQELPDSLTQLWVCDDPPRPLDYASLAALCDSFFPRVMVRRRRRVSAGTVSITVYFHADANQLAAQSDRPVLGVARGANFRNGYLDQNAEIWGDDGTLLASSHQMVYYRD